MHVHAMRICPGANQGRSRMVSMNVMDYEKLESGRRIGGICQCHGAGSVPAGMESNSR